MDSWKMVFFLFQYAHAHGGPAEIPKDFFEFKWTWDPTLVFFLLLAVLYGWGLRCYRGHAPVARWQVVLFYSGIAVLSLAYLPPVDTLSDSLFSMHMFQHLLITAVGMPLVVFGAPFVIVARALPVRARYPLAPLFRWLNQKAILPPLAALMLFEGVFWFWHIPKFYNMALKNDVIHLIEHACMAFAAFQIWRLLIDPRPLSSPLKIPIRILLIGLMMTLDMALSAALTYSERVWYAYDQLPLPQWWIWDRLQDQRLGGLIMWVPGSLIWLLAVGVSFVVWAQHEETPIERNRIPWPVRPRDGVM